MYCSMWYGDNLVGMLLLSSIGKFKNIPDIECVLVHKFWFWQDQCLWSVLATHL